MKVNTKAITYRQNGCNRGGADHVLQLVEKLPALPDVPPNFELVDPEPGRAAALAPILASRGLPVRVSQDTAPLSPRTTADVYAVDDVTVPARVLEQPLRSPLVGVALLVSVPTIESAGGVVIAVAAAVTPDNAHVQGELRVLLDQIAGFAPGRRSSAFMADRGIHAEQMPRARHAAHDWLTTRSASFLADGEVEPGIVMVDGFTGTEYRVELAEVRRNHRRRDLRSAALNEILPEFTQNGSLGGVVFHERQDPWLYVVLARPGASRWRLDRAFELPVLRLRPYEKPVRVRTFVTD